MNKDINPLTDLQRKEAENSYRNIINSPYARGEKLAEYIEPLDFEKNFLGSYIFDICDYFGLPFTNNIGREGVIEIGEFMEAINYAVKQAGYTQTKESK